MAAYIEQISTAVIWYFMTAASVVISVMILIGADKLFDFLPQLIQMIREAFGSSGPVVLPAFILSQMAAGTLMIYSSMALGHLFQKNRLMYSFAMYCALYAAYQIILAILILLLGNNLFESLLQSAAPTPAQLNSLFGMLAAVAVLMAVVHCPYKPYSYPKTESGIGFCIGTCMSMQAAGRVLIRIRL